ncbi:hypothetical protein QPX34_07570 [Corynebacterium accolens]|uniref:Uncharacterized protein n=1 Tax=Corynebacterium accolens TaxID=38284 RepID=A0ABT7FQL3_9CORY|nr:hypothetical protein [Corynebacterium accolens]MDK4247884.1 hypothetical protein [Corynebacterium accolens]MDK4323839.1 hypothetical protein [Corynebacterium accolens]
MSQGMNTDQFLSETKNHIAHLKNVDSFLEHLDSLDGSDLQGWDYLLEKTFFEERDSLFDVITVLEKELLPEIEGHT